MKPSVEIFEDYTEMENALKNNKEQQKAAYKRKDFAAMERYAKSGEETAEMLPIIKSNYRIALFNEVVPIIADAFLKYKGKKIGERTIEKIRAEVEEKASIHFYISKGQEYSYPYISIEDKNNILQYSDRITVTFYTNHQPMFDEEGRLNELTAEYIKEAATRCESPELYIENVSEHTKKILTEKENIRKDFQELETKIKNLNQMLRGGKESWHISLSK